MFRHGEPEKFNSFADLNGCIVDEMLMSPHDQSVPELVRELAKKKHIVVHVNTLVLRKITVQERYFEAAMLRVRDLADALTSVRRIVWTGFDWKHSYYLKQYRHMDWFRDYRLPAPVEIVGACGVGLIELLHHIHPNGGNSVTKHVEDTSCGKLLEEIQKVIYIQYSSSGI